MPLQNRVDPFGKIHAVDARGLFTGNRGGAIHDPATKTLLNRRWSNKSWIICTCEYKSVRREVMGRNANGGAAWTELFFLDEVTALAAGHRPCFTCRREQAKEFAACFGRAFGIAEPKAPQIDAKLHRERLASSGRLVELDKEALDALPDGAMVFQGKRTFAKCRGVLKAWTFWGWADDWDYYDLARYDTWLATPPATVEVLRQGYKPVWHPTADRT